MQLYVRVRVHLLITNYLMIILSYLWKIEELVKKVKVERELWLLLKEEIVVVVVEKELEVVVARKAAEALAAEALAAMVVAVVEAAQRWLRRRCVAMTLKLG